MSPLDEQGNYVAPDRPRTDADVASAARTVSGTGASFQTVSTDSLEATLSVSAASGTSPTLDVVLETSIDGGVTWDTVGAFTQQTAVGSDGHVFGPLGDLSRWRWTIGGTTPSFTFAIDAEANQ